mmetsp:Transcript_4219/g.19125  ORF Transcript_4219/g.19125 Transcript_4219/m.19125 type:complete len:203 (+) Transcript_4219:250-858(+)
MNRRGRRRGRTSRPPTRRPAQPPPRVPPPATPECPPAAPVRFHPRRFENRLVPVCPMQFADSTRPVASSPPRPPRPTTATPRTPGTAPAPVSASSRAAAWTCSFDRFGRNATPYSGGARDIHTAGTRLASPRIPPRPHRTPRTSGGLSHGFPRRTRPCLPRWRVPRFRSRLSRSGLWHSCRRRVLLLLGSLLLRRRRDLCRR